VGTGEHLGGEAEGHFEGVGPVVVVGDGEFLELVHWPTSVCTIEFSDQLAVSCLGREHRRRLAPAFGDRAGGDRRALRTTDSARPGDHRLDLGRVPKWVIFSGHDGTSSQSGGRKTYVGHGILSHSRNRE